jgi:hypothetical protein
VARTWPECQWSAVAGSHSQPVDRTYGPVLEFLSHSSSYAAFSTGPEDCHHRRTRVRCVAGAVSHREEARASPGLAAQAHNNKPKNDRTRAAHIR